jgi:predicted O-methyltransferase YrrM
LHAFFQYLLKAQSRYSIHSPFLFDYLQNGLRRKIPQNLKHRVYSYRKALQHDTSYIKTTDHGAGSRVFSKPERRVNNILKTSGMSKRKTRLILKTLAYFQPESILELGTSLGMGSAVLGAEGAKVISVEGCPETANKARHYLQKYGYNNVKIIQQRFNEALPSILQEQKFDWYYIDGNHAYEPTLEYFKQILPLIENHTICIFDDIHWSEDMEKAWKKLIEFPEVRLSLDFYELGMLFFKKELSKEHKIIRFI